MDILPTFQKGKGLKADGSLASTAPYRELSWQWSFTRESFQHLYTKRWDIPDEMDVSLDKLPAWTHEKSKIQSSETSPKAHGDSNIGKVPMSKEEDLSLGV